MKRCRKMNKTSDNGNAIRVENLVKKFGDLTALKGVSFKVKKGDIVGYLGPNGAGKTTTIKLLTNLLSPTFGKVYINGINVNKNPQKALSYVGSLIEVPGIYGYLTPNELMTHFGKVYRMSSERITKRIKKVLSTVRLGDWEHKKIEEFSTGMKRRLAIGMALLPEPEILILDEPVMGLDPKGIKEIRELINKLGEKEITIFLSSHLLQEVSLTCNKVIFLFEGEIVAYDDVEKILEAPEHKRISVEFLNPLSKDEIDSLRSLKPIGKVKVEGNEAKIDNGGEKRHMHKILSLLVEEGLEVVSFNYEKKDLEDLYISLAGENE
ncbi:ABC transporter ATP-binding protein [archaeon SCG-AAA382B04]|nr:ABC transporter ATP-binding protein [archaeon SCG-AAA382B04]